MKSKRMTWFGLGQKAGTVIFWIAVVIGLSIAGYFLSKTPMAWPQHATVVQLQQPYATGKMIDSFNGIPEIAYPVTAQTLEGQQFTMTLSKEDFARCQAGQQIRYMKNPLSSLPQYRLK